MDVRVGCCGWPEARLRYFEEFPVVELQDTFYQPPPVELARKWRQAAPPGFRFTLKAWQIITHSASSPTYRKLREPPPEARRGACGGFQPTPEVDTAWQRTLAVARALEAPAIVFQCPASFRLAAANIAQVRQFFRRIEREGRLLVWEPRGEWDAAIVRALCEELGLVHCVDPFQAEPVTAGVFYFRLHGVGGYRYRYSDGQLEELKRRLREHDCGGYVLFNNTNMKEDARRLLRAIG